MGIFPNQNYSAGVWHSLPNHWNSLKGPRSTLSFLSLSILTFFPHHYCSHLLSFSLLFSVSPLLFPPLALATFPLVCLTLSLPPSSRSLYFAVDSCQFWVFQHSLWFLHTHTLSSLTVATSVHTWQQSFSWCNAHNRSRNGLLAVYIMGGSFKYIL